MMKLSVYSTLFICLLSTCALGQYRLTGVVKSAKDSATVSECQLYINGRHMTTTDVSGRFVFQKLSGKSHTIQAVAPQFRILAKRITMTHHTEEIVLYLEELSNELDEVQVTEKSTDFGFSRLKGVDGGGIYEGKKSEVITPDQLVANLATNNARQIYARVAGLNIWENEGGGLQLSIGGRGLDPNRTANFNVRQNGHDISADALGYPESYYTPLIEAVGKIQIVRGAASLQYGTQFGGLINFVLRKPVTDKKFELVARQSAGSFGFYNAFTSVSQKIGRLSHYTYFQYKRSDGWRKNATFNSYNFYTDIDYKLSEKSSVGIDVTHMNYLAKQPGGLSDAMFEKDPRQTNRERNWFDVNWNMLALHFDHKFTQAASFNLRVFGLAAHRYSVGFRPNRVATIDDHSERDLIKGSFENWGAEARYLNRYKLGQKQSVLLVGGRYYHGTNLSMQGQGTTGKGADFDFVEPEKYLTYDYRFPNRNVALFAENIFYLNDYWSITPGLRYESIHTEAQGYYGSVVRDLAGNVIQISKTNESRRNPRQFLLAGLGVSYKPRDVVEFYGNLSQNYRSITFNDMRISNPSSVIDPDMKDERGYSFDLGVRSHQTTFYNYDVSLFYLNYNNRIGEVQFYDESDRVLRLRSNVGQAVIMGVESYGEADLMKVLNPDFSSFSLVAFSNVAWIKSVYRRSKMTGIKGNEVEFVPKINMKIGARAGYKRFKGSLQLTYMSDQFSDATNAREGGISSVVGLIPAYRILDLSLSYGFKRMRLEGSINNLTNEMYFTRRATGYPGPGILPSDGRGFYVTFEIKL